MPIFYEFTWLTSTSDMVRLDASYLDLIT